MSLVLVDNSVLQRLDRSPAIRVELLRLTEAGATFCSSPMSVLEAGFSARNSAEHAAVLDRLTRSFTLLPLTSEATQTALELQALLFAAGHGRAAGAMDLLQAAIAIHHSATLLHYDSDFDTIAAAYPALSARWVLQRGSID